MPRSRWIISLLISAACGCASPGPIGVDAHRSSTPSRQTAEVSDAKDSFGPQVTLTSSIRGQAPDGDPFDDSHDDVGTATLDSPKPPRAVRRAGHGMHASPTYFTPAERRGQADCPAPCDVCPPGAPCGSASFGCGPYPAARPYGIMPLPCGPGGAAPPLSLPRLYPDEYLCDGGDRAYPVHYDDYHRLGLDTEDTVGEFVDSNGDFRMKPSTRVCLYAPRFGAMRSVSGPQADTSVHHVASAIENTVGASLRNRDATSYHAQRQGSERLRVRARLSGIESEAAGFGTHQTTSIAAHTKLYNAYEDLLFVKTGRLHTADEARLSLGIQGGMYWTRPENPVIAATTSGLHEVRAKFLPMEIVGREDRRKPGDLRIVKLADKKTAQPGDLVTFTLRYDNLGDLPVSHVRIIDNLTPRLEYVDDSATSDRAGAVTTEDNHEGSVILTIELDEPLPGRQGGVITFQATVR